MAKKETFYLVEESALPSALLKTLKAKELLETKKVSTASEAAQQAGISRGAFYKYKDLIKPFYDLQDGKKVTLFLIVEDVTGVLSHILAVMARVSANVLTINQNIPLDKIANITLTVDMKNASCKTHHLLKEIQEIEGVKKADIVSSGK